MGPAPQASRVVTAFDFVTVIPLAPFNARVLDVWIPIPSDGAYQTIVGLAVLTNLPYHITQEPKFGNRMVHLQIPRESTPTTITVSFVAIRNPVQILTLRADGTRTPPPDAKTAKLPPSRFLLQADRLGPVGARYAAIAHAIVGDRTRTRSQIRALFDNILTTVAWDGQQSPTIGEGDSAYVYSSKKGNDIDLSSYLVSLTRSLGIPAYLEFGLPVVSAQPTSELRQSSGSVDGVHCWAWIDDSEVGWFPADVGDAHMAFDRHLSEQEDFLFGDLTTERCAVALSRGRDITLEPPQAARPLNFFVRPYAEADGVPVEVTWRAVYALPRHDDGPKKYAVKPEER